MNVFVSKDGFLGARRRRNVDEPRWRAAGATLVSPALQRGETSLNKETQPREGRRRAAKILVNAPFMRLPRPYSPFGAKYPLRTCTFIPSPHCTEMCRNVPSSLVLEGV